MQRFRIMHIYSTFLVLLLVLVIGGVAWIRLPANSQADDVSAPGPVSADLKMPEKPTSMPADSHVEVKVSIDNFTFKPKEVSIPVGATVTWVNHDDVPHTATSAAMPRVFDSKALDTDDKYSFTFTKPGTYRYYCKIHTHMTGTVTVK